MAIFDGLDASVITHIISIMKQQIFLPFQYIIVAGQSGYGIIFIVTGEVQLFKLEGIEEIPLKVYSQGSFISETMHTPQKQDKSPASPITSDSMRVNDESSGPNLCDRDSVVQSTGRIRAKEKVIIIARSISYCTTFRMSFEGLRIIHEMYPSVARRLNAIFKSHYFDSQRTEFSEATDNEQ